MTIADKPKEQQSRSTAAPIILVILAVLVAVTAAFGVGLATGRGHGAGVGDARLLGSVETACERWIADRMPVGVDDSWCRGMGDWMRRAGPAEMMGSWSWDRAEDLRAGCRKWMAGDDRDDGTMWCDEMVDWMRYHMVGTPGGWMMRGSLRG